MNIIIMIVISIDIMFVVVPGPIAIITIYHYCNFDNLGSHLHLQLSKTKAFHFSIIFSYFHSYFIPPFNIASFHPRKSTLYFPRVCFAAFYFVFK